MHVLQQMTKPERGQISKTKSNSDDDDGSLCGRGPKISDAPYRAKWRMHIR